MNTLTAILWIETRKAMRSRIPLVTALGFLIMPLAGAFFIFVYKDPELARKLGLISAKASMVLGSADWPSYMKMVIQMVGLGGFFLFCLVTSWIFGREYADGTLKDMLAVPVPRISIVLAKFIVMGIWCIALSVETYLASMLIGVMMQLPLGTGSVILQGSSQLAIIACLAVFLVTPFAFFASVGGGYLLPVGVMFLIAILANVMTVAGWGDYFPWAVPGQLAQGNALMPASYWIVILTGLAGIAATYAWWLRADHKR